MKKLIMFSLFLSLALFCFAQEGDFLSAGNGESKLLMKNFNLSPPLFYSNSSFQPISIYKQPPNIGFTPYANSLRQNETIQNVALGLVIGSLVGMLGGSIWWIAAPDDPGGPILTGVGLVTLGVGGIFAITIDDIDKKRSERRK